MEKTTQREKILKLLKTSEKEKNLKSNQEKKETLCTVVKEKKNDSRLLVRNAATQKAMKHSS